jgi:hypothetical protein
MQTRHPYTHISINTHIYIYIHAPRETEVELSWKSMAILRRTECWVMYDRAVKECVETQKHRKSSRLSMRCRRMGATAVSNQTRQRCIDSGCTMPNCKQDHRLTERGRVGQVKDFKHVGDVALIEPVQQRRLEMWLEK